MDTCILTSTWSSSRKTTSLYLRSKLRRQWHLAGTQIINIPSERWLNGRNDSEEAFFFCSYFNTVRNNTIPHHHNTVQTVRATAPSHQPSSDARCARDLRRACFQVFKNAAIDGGPAGGNTSYDESLHFLYRRIVVWSVLTWIYEYSSHHGIHAPWEQWKPAVYSRYAIVSISSANQVWKSFRHAIVVYCLFKYRQPGLLCTPQYFALRAKF